MLRKIFFWLHLAAGLSAGLVIAIMSFTGAAIAFEKNLIAWAERDVRRIVPPPEISNSKSQIPNPDTELSNPKSEIQNRKFTRIPLRALLARVREKEPATRLTGLTVSADPTAAIALTLGRDNVYYANPYTGELNKRVTTPLHDFMHLMEDWHRFLGFGGASTRPVGKAITGACNLAFLFLALSGLYLWWPRNWTWRGIKALAVFNFRLAGKARDFNWHNSIGFWTAPLLIVLTLTAIPISYRWGNAFVYHLTGTEPPGPNPGTTHLTGPTNPDPGAKPLGYDALLATVQNQIPHWSEITFRLGNSRSPRRDSRPSSTSENPESSSPQPIAIVVRTPDAWPLFSTTTLSLDPFTAAILRQETFADQNAGRRLRSWTRFLHTGEALGWPGQFLAALASLGALFLVWTGLALTFRRFFPPKQIP